MDKAEILNIGITKGSYNDFILSIVNAAQAKQSLYICVANVHMLIEAYKSKEYAKSLNNASLVTPDGMPLTWALKFIYGIKQERVSGMDLLPDLINECIIKKVSVFFYGGTEDLLAKTKDFLQKNYPDLLLAGFLSPPFRNLSDSENESIIKQINRSGAGLVFVILGCPKQEKWMALAQGRISAATIGVGGALPVFIRIKKRAPKWMQNAGLEWLFRLMQEPKRLFKRYAITNTIFIFLILKNYLFSGIH